MSHDFDIFVKAHLPEVLSEAKKNQALAFFKSVNHNQYNRTHLKLSKQPIAAEIQLQDCAILLSFSHNQL